MISRIEKYEVWSYLSTTQKDLILEGHYLAQFVQKGRFKDYSFLVFPYAKAYEGYLKQLFLDIDFISHLDYISDHFRLGKYLTPHLIGKLGDRSLYSKIRKNSTEDLAKKIWDIWSKGRNKVFHYYPHNLRRLDYQEALETNNEFMQVMVETYEKLKQNK